MRRDFTYIDDVVEAIVRLIDRAPQGNPDWSGDKPDPGSSAAPWRVYNIGNNNPADVPKVVAILEKELGRIAQKELLPMQSGAYADVDDRMREIGFRPSTSIEDGVRRFVAWFREYHSI